MQVAIEQDESTIHSQICLLPQEIEKLFEAAQMGASGALNALHDFTGIYTDIHLNCLSFMPLPVLIDRIRLYYPDHIAFHLRFAGEINGEIYTFFQEKDAITLIRQMMGPRWLKNNKILNRMEISMLTELVNILSNSFWRSLTEKASLNWWFTPPARISNLERVLNYSAKVYLIDYLLVHYEYLIEALGIRVQLIMLPTKSTMKKILSKLNPLPLQEIE
jgi:chemotaxis protein CheY-P-specific phosphatase CheC